MLLYKKLLLMTFGTTYVYMYVCMLVFVCGCVCVCVYVCVCVCVCVFVAFFSFASNMRNIYFLLVMHFFYDPHFIGSINQKSFASIFCWDAEIRKTAKGFSILN